MDEQGSIARAWGMSLFRGEGEAPRVSRLFVFEYAGSLRLVDLRRPEEGCGLMGHIPASGFLKQEELEQLKPGAPLVLISKKGGEASKVARRLEQKGLGPVIDPSLGGHQVFVNHQDVAAFKRQGYVRFHCGP